MDMSMYYHHDKTYQSSYTCMYFSLINAPMPNTFIVMHRCFEQLVTETR